MSTFTISRLYVQILYNFLGLKLYFTLQYYYFYWLYLTKCLCVWLIIYKMLSIYLSRYLSIYLLSLSIYSSSYLVDFLHFKLSGMSLHVKTFNIGHWCLKDIISLCFFPPFLWPLDNPFFKLFQTPNLNKSFVHNEALKC